MATNKREAMEESLEIVKKWAGIISSVAWVPASSISFGRGEVKMSLEIAAIYKVELDEKSAVNLLTSVSKILKGSNFVGFALDLIPILGWAIKPFLANEVIEKIGEELISYFNDHSNLPE